MVTQALALVAAAFLLGFPVRAFLAAPEAPLPVKAAWVVLLAIGLRPAWRPWVLIALTPFLPWVPFAVNGVPHGIVHLVVISQGLPWLVARGLRRSTAPLDPIGWCWLLVLVVAATAGVPYYAGFARQYEQAWPLLADLAAQLSEYVFLRPSIEFANILVAVTALGDGALTWLVVRSSPGPMARLVQLAAASAVGVAGAGVWQKYTGVGLRLEWRLNDPYLTRVNGTFSDPNALAAFLSVMVPLIVALAGREDGRRRLAWLGGAAVAAAALVLTAGRVGTLGAVIGLAVLALGALRLGLDRRDSSAVVRRYFRRSVYAALVLVPVAAGLLVVAGTTLDARHHRQQSYLDTWLYTFNLRRPVDETAKGRIAIWRTAGRIVRDHPVFGVGPGRIFRIFPNYSQDVPEAPQGMPLSAHDTFLNVAAELGVVGLAAWLALVGVTLHAAWRGASPGPGGAQDGEEWIGVGLFGAWCACLVTMTTGDRAILREDLVTLGVITALVARRTPWTAQSPRWRHACAAATLALLVVLPFRIRAARHEVRLDRVTYGLHAVEGGPDGSTFRWTTGRAVFHLPPSTATLTLRLRSLAPFPQAVRVLVQQASVAELTLVDHDWVTTRIVLAKPRDEYHRVEIVVTPTWQPPGESRELGVMLAWEGR